MAKRYYKLTTAKSTSSESGTTIRFNNIQLFKEDTLGVGSYGKVCRARCDNLPCAAKIIHETLIDPTAEQLIPQGHGHRLPIRRFEQECEFLNTIRHPNIIQYLGMYTDPDTGLPVLLMELMDDSLTHFLEAATQQISYHIQVNICHDIAMALTFLHVNGIVHRDLSSNNVLLISNGVRAKVTDFGMARLGDIKTRVSRLTYTMCPGTDVYMPPEAIKDHPIYSEKIDCFSFGVIIVQLLTRQFPKPGERMQKVEINHPGLPRGMLMVCIPEIDRRENHISQLDPNNTLLQISLDCLKDKDDERPSAQQLCERAAALKEQSEYINNASLRAAETKERHLEEKISSLRENHAREIASQNTIIEAKQYEVQDLIRSHDEAIQARDREIQELKEQLQRATYERKKHDQKQLETEIRKISISNRQESACPTDIKLSWRWGKRAPRRMARWCNAAVGDGIIYFNVVSEITIYSYNVHNELWSQLLDCPRFHCSFVVVNSLLTSIGGVIRGKVSNKLLSIKEYSQQMQWVEDFPPMPTSRYSTTSLCTKADLIVAGGEFGKSILSNVEVMNIETRQWSIASSMPDGIRCGLGIICEDCLYIGGGYNSKSVYYCSTSDLLLSCRSASQSVKKKYTYYTLPSVWNKLTDLPEAIAECSTPLSLCGQLLAIGGRTGSSYTGAVYVYKTATKSWELISHMLMARGYCFAVPLPGTNEIVVVGGVSDGGYTTDTVEFADLM